MLVMLGAAAGAGVGLGLWLIVLSVLPAPALTESAVAGGDGGAPDGPHEVAGWGEPSGPLVRAAVALLAGLGVELLTGWPVAALVAAVAAWFAFARVRDLRRDRGHGVGPGHRDRVARLEALAAWTESLAATLAAAAGLEQAIIATTRTPPDALAQPLRALGDAVAAGARLPDALAAFARDVDDASTDAVVAALQLAATRGGAALREPLSQLAQATREQVTAARQVEIGRTQIRTDTRLVAGLAAIVIGALVVFNRGFLTPYDGVLGQVVLGVVALMAVGAFVWMRRLGQVEDPARVVHLTTDHRPGSW